MGKYAKGASVRDPDGDICEIIGKPRKGFREVRYNGGKLDGFTLVWSKSSLEAVANDNEVSASAEIVVKAYSSNTEVSEVASAKVWAIGERATSQAGEQVTIDSDVDASNHVWVKKGGTRWRIPTDWLRAAWEPKAGDRVRLLKDGFSTTGAVGKLATISAFSDDTVVDRDQYLLKIDGPLDYQTMAVTPEFTRATIDAFELIIGEELKVGDRVNWTKSRDAWQGGVIVEIDNKGPWPVEVEHPKDGRGAFNLDELELASAFPKGTLVSLTVTGKVSGIGGDGNVNIVFAGLPPGKNSFALPPAVLAAA